jgi:tRNA(fMet)-specific endonuclease VapC
MTLFLLDTDTLSLYQRGHLLVTQNIATRLPDDVAVSVISVEEQLTGWYTRIRQAKKRPELAEVYRRFANAIRFLSGLQIIGFSEPAMIRYERLRKSHRNIGKNDLRIAAIALEEGAKVVTRNRVDFQRIARLPIVDWSQ